MNGSLPNLRDLYEEIWLADFEYALSPEGRPIPVCMVAHEGYDRKPKLRLFAEDLIPERPPIDFHDRVLFVSYNAVAELSCFLVLGWPTPKRILDLYVEFIFIRNTISTESASGNKLLQALAHFGLDSLDATEKREMQQLALRGGPFSTEERIALLNYCESDVVALKRLTPRIIAKLPDWTAALFRGRYMVAVTKMNATGIPIDVDRFSRTMSVREQIVLKLTENANLKHDVFEEGKFKVAKFAKLLEEKGIAWPETEKTKAPCTDMDTMRDMALTYPEFADLAMALRSKKELNEVSLHVLADGFSRPSLFPFGSNTGRNQARNFIFGMSAWFRSFIQPKPGYALAYVDWSQQEFGVAGGLSDDLQMIFAYNSGDPYLEFAKQARAVPPDATKSSHKAERDLYKTAALAVLYGQGVNSLSVRLGISLAEAEDLIERHKLVYKRFWEWSEEHTSRATLYGEVFTRHGLANDSSP